MTGEESLKAAPELYRSQVSCDRARGAQARER